MTFPEDNDPNNPETWQISIRSANALKSLGLTSFDAIQKFGLRQLLRTPNVGRKVTNEVGAMIGGWRDSAEIPSITVLWWEYFDKSSCGPMRAYFDEKRAEEDLELLREADAGRVFSLLTVPYKR